jgi:hypothetical protein
MKPRYLCLKPEEPKESYEIAGIQGETMQKERKPYLADKLRKLKNVKVEEF